ncbi:MAG: HAD family hydrolase [Drouetiella hepatica Uher 2000/2452]|jgi:phosphoglycolate phosphatase-like HAD superfamily hydrolase|uniref:HAD family hydrolase n=1 Tax=Drouetiella hepatica Uher 2000/2452 TaxID=904376 RepID=A0A951UKS6_9CYAN|nr:HAD family hydrolase [Drouetiella hepatica Uher 2000/2452]
MPNLPTLLALDFDGVVCDGLIEYFQTSWLTYCQIWKPVDDVPPPGLAERFYHLRPVIETGWEMPLLVRSLLEDIPEAELFAHWATIAQQQLQKLALTPGEIAAQLDGVRDAWINADAEDWLAQQRFYPGVVDRLRQVIQSETQLFIITTKEQRFVRQLLQQQQIEIPESRIFGKEAKQPKADTLRALIQKFTQELDESVTVWFVEDRLKTLHNIAPQPDLAAVKLYLADWGYNTEADREVARQSDRIHLLSLETFVRDFTAWI